MVGGSTFFADLRMTPFSSNEGLLFKFVTPLISVN